uniref:S-layer homology domain-containing protein n=1 Tax=Bifidobacterium sp. AGR2158 TaxID=1280675 RepID=UPI0018C9370B
GGKSASIIVTVQEDGPVLQSIQITGEGVENNALTIKSNQRHQLSAKLNPENAVVGALTWSSSDSSVATVNGNGLVTPKAPGVSAITVTAGNRHASIVLTVVKADSTFPDVPKSHHFYNDVEWLVSNKLTQGNPDGTFGPKDDTTRAHTVVFLYRLAVQRGDKGAANYKPTAADYKRFPDVKEGSFAAKEILWAASIGLTKGRNDGTFGGQLPVTRAEMITFLNRFATMEGSSSAANFKPSDKDYEKFTDVKKNTFAAREILWGIDAGIVNGGEEKFNGNNSTPREHMAAFLHRLDTHLN